MSLSEFGPLQWIAAIVAVVVGLFLAIAALWQRPQPAAAKNHAKPAAKVREDDYPELQIPPELHLELAMDPPSGMHCSNPWEPYPFENNFCWGSYLFFHPPTHSREEVASGGLDYREYFKGKKRLWELRVQFHFKQPPPPDTELYFGVELEDYVPLNAAARHTVTISVAAIRKAVGGVYQTPGDDPSKVKGELERPACVLPLWAFDQFIETPAGQQPPSLTDPRFPELGKKRYKRVAEYAQEISQLTRSFKTGSTYTFGFWGNSRFLDALNWRLVGIPVVTPLDFDVLAGRPPVYAVLYSLKPNSATDKDGRHLQSRKNYYFRAAIWSSARRPERSRFEVLTGAKWSNPDESVRSRSTAGNATQRKGGGLFKGSFACCMARTEATR